MPVYFAAPVSSDDVGGFHLGGYDAGKYRVVMKDSAILGCRIVQGYDAG